MDAVKLSTPEEVEEIAMSSDLSPGAVVVSFGPDRAVIRTVLEIDPVFCENPKRKAWLVSHLETWLRLNGVSSYYFNISANDSEWKETVERWGAKQVSTEPELRFKKEL